jgi:hypothetical protein
MADTAALAATPKNELVHKFQRLQNTVKAARVQGQRVAKLGADSLLTVAGGATAGVLSIKMPKFPGTQIDADVAIGSACVLAALFDVADGYDAELNAFGSGLLAAAAARETATHLAAKEQK